MRDLQYWCTKIDGITVDTEEPPNPIEALALCRALLLTAAPIVQKAAGSPNDFDQGRRMATAAFEAMRAEAPRPVSATSNPIDCLPAAEAINDQNAAWLRDSLMFMIHVDAENLKKVRKALQDEDLEAARQLCGGDALICWLAVQAFDNAVLDLGRYLTRANP